MSKHFAFDSGSVARMVRMARRVGLDGVALTEHFHARGYWDIPTYLEATYPCAGGVFWAGGVALIPGAEVNIREGAHVIVLAETAEIDGSIEPSASPYRAVTNPRYASFST